MNEFRLDHKVAVITGGGSGIGAGIARVFAENGAIVYLLDINPRTEEVVNDIQTSGGQAFWYHTDITDQQLVVQNIQQIQDENPIHILVNNAGVGLIGKLHETSEDDLDRLYRINVKGMYNCMYAAIPHLQKNGGGVILNMASIVAAVGIPDRFAYSMTKGAVLTMTYSVALDYIKDNIRCNCISPARIHTPFVDAYLAKNYPGQEQDMFDLLSKTQPMGRMGTPREVALLALYLCSDAAAFITGNNYPIDGGFTNLIP